MSIGISDIQQKENDKIEVTFCIYPSAIDVVILTLEKKTMWEIATYCHEHLSYGSELRKLNKIK